jgi:broad specificity phosphatase PhoE
VATKIMFIRHGEKPDDNGSVRGVDENGTHDPNELTVRGWQRAGALVRFFAPPNGKFSHADLATPTALFAAAAHGHIKSVRSEHTIQPLARYLNKSTDLHYGRGDEDELVRTVKATQGVVLIAWEHEAIPEMAATIVGNSDICPRKWPDSRFDLVWILEQRPASAWALTQVPQLLLPGDRAEIVELAKAGGHELPIH